MTKKRFIALFIAIIMIATLLTGCNKESSENINSEKTVTAVGSYAVFRTEEVQEYLNFLETFNESKYEIVDISTSMWTGAYGSGEFYIVTYRTIAE